MTKFLIIICGLIFSSGYKDNEAIITIVDIGHLNRNGLAKELVIINKYSPKVIGLDFLLTFDSLDEDISLAEQLSKISNIVQATKLHDNDPGNIVKWNSLERSHSKFRFGEHGFSNHTITDDSIIVPALPMRQYYRNKIEFAFSYVIASKYDPLKIYPKYKNDDKDFSFDKTIFNQHFKVISIHDLLTGHFDKRDLTDKIVLMGEVSGSDDLFYVDHSRTKRISGVEFQASIIKAILN